MPGIDVAVGVVRDKSGRVLIARRKQEVHQGGLWEFPGGKFEQGEDDRQALNRELFEELNIKIINASPLIKINFNYPDINVHLHVQEVHDFDGEPVGHEGQVCRWVAVEELSSYAFPEANKAIITAIKLGRHYAIIGGNTPEEVLRELDNVAGQDVWLVQIRVKDLCKSASEEILEVARLKCTELGMAYLINSQMPVTRNPAEGLHLSSYDLMSLNQRPKGPGFVAASCHNLQELRKAEQLALDFAVLSPIKETTSHACIKVLGWQQFEDWVSEVNIPVFALGGLGKQDLDCAISSGAQGLAGISLFKAPGQKY